MSPLEVLIKVWGVWLRPLKAFAVHLLTVIIFHCYYCSVNVSVSLFKFGLFCSIVVRRPLSVMFVRTSLNCDKFSSPLLRKVFPCHFFSHFLWLVVFFFDGYDFTPVVRQKQRTDSLENWWMPGTCRTRSIFLAVSNKLKIFRCVASTVRFLILPLLSG